MSSDAHKGQLARWRERHGSIRMIPKAEKTGMDCFYAARCGNVELVEKLVKRGECTVTTTRWSGVTLLHRAAGEGQAEVISLLISLGANPAAKTHRGQDTPLHLAMGAGHELAAEALLRGGSPWHTENKAGHTPMRHAVNLGFALMARRLELSYFRFDAVRRKKAEQGIKEEPATVVLSPYTRELKPSEGQAKAEAHRNRFKTMFAKVNDCLGAKRFTKIIRNRKRPDDASVESESTAEESITTTESGRHLSDQERDLIRANREKEKLEDRERRDKAIEEWTFDPTDEKKRAEALAAFGKRLEGAENLDDGLYEEDVDD